MGKVTIQELSKILVEKNGLSQRDASKFGTTMFALILEYLERGEQVKVKGLGTFRIINVEARESVSVRTGERVVIESHSKVSFTPDATMKELVNKPFSQFETVVLNDGVEFNDIREQPEQEEDVDTDVDEVADVVDTEADVPQEETPVVEMVAEAVTVDALVSNEATRTADETDTTDDTETAEETETADEVETADELRPDNETVVEEASVSEMEEHEEQPTEEFVFDNEEEHSSWKRSLLYAACVLLLMGLSAYGGYYYGSHAADSRLAAVDTLVVRDTVLVASLDTMIQEQPELVQVEAEEAIVDEQPEKPVEKVAQAEPADKYAAKDERVRLGAYRIVGTAEEVKVLPGQTFYSICRAHLGPDMECYVEVYNDLERNPQIKAGQVIKIPKLELKKRQKK